MKFGKKILAVAGLCAAAATAQAYNGLYEVEVTGLQGLNILEGSTVWQPSPVYPSMALRRGLEGQVLVEYTISADGKAENIRILEASPRGFFNNVTINSLKHATFGVSYQDGVAVPVTGVKKRFIFRIEEDSNRDNSQSVAIAD